MNETGIIAVVGLGCAGKTFYETLSELVEQDCVVVRLDSDCIDSRTDISQLIEIPSVGYIPVDSKFDNSFIERAIRNTANIVSRDMMVCNDVIRRSNERTYPTLKQLAKRSKHNKDWWK